MIGRRFSIAITTAALGVSSFLTGALTFAQQPTPEPPPPEVNNQRPQDQTDNANSTGDASSLEHPVAVTTTEPAIRQINTAGFLMPSVSPLSWGPLYVAFAQFSEVYEPASSLNGAGNESVTASQFSAGIVFDKRHRNVHLAIQYVPRVTILNGEVLTNFANQDTGVDMVFSLTPRLSVNVSDHFIYYKSNDYFANTLLTGDALSGTTLQRDFLRVPGTWLSESVTASFNYSLSARTRIVIAPYYVYANSSGQGEGLSYSTVNEYSINAGVTHDLTAQSSVSVTYLSQTDVYAGQSSNSTFQTFQGGYSHTLTGGWSFSGSVGFTTAGIQNSRTWAASGYVSGIKRFRRSQANVAYNRGHTFAGYITQQLSDRIDANYQQYAGRRWTFGGGVGYFRDASTGNGIRAKYGEGNLSFGLAPTVSVFGSYVYQWQSSNNSVVSSGNTNFLRVGIQWKPRQPYQR